MPNWFKKYLNRTSKEEKMGNTKQNELHKSNELKELKKLEDYSEDEIMDILKEIF